MLPMSATSSERPTTVSSTAEQHQDNRSPSYRNIHVRWDAIEFLSSDNLKLDDDIVLLTRSFERRSIAQLPIQE